MLTDQAGVMLKEFIRVYGASLDPRVWLTFIQEEKKELEEELTESFTRSKILKELTDLQYVMVGFTLVSAGAEQLELFSEQEHAEVMDLLQEAADTIEKAMDYLPDSTAYIEAFRRVHQSNMSKLGEDGKPIRREDGKILKGPNYKEPKLDDLCSVILM